MKSFSATRMFTGIRVQIRSRPAQTAELGE